MRPTTHRSHRAWAYALIVPLLATSRAAAQSPDGFTVELLPEHAAFPRYDAPGAIAHAPAGFDDGAPLHLVVFLHGYSGCARGLMYAGPVRCRAGDPVREGWDLAAHHDAAGRNTLFVVPQLAFMKRDGKPGCFGKAGCFRRFLSEVLAGLPRRRALDDVASITLVAHSAGFRTALAILEHGDIDALVKHVVLMDALYADAPAFARWIAETPVRDARLLSIYLNDGKTYQHSRALHRLARRTLGAERVAKVKSDDIAPSLADHAVVVASGRGAHAEVPQNYLASVLAALGLPPR